MGQKKYVQLNPKASIFFDQTTGIKVIGKEVVELTEAQFHQKTVVRALANGYLKEVVKPEEKKSNEKEATQPQPSSEENPLKEKLLQLLSDGNDPEKIKESFTLNELKELAMLFDIEPESGDTKMDLVSAILDEVETK